MHTLITGTLAIVIGLACIVFLSGWFEMWLLDPVFMTGWVLASAMGMQVFMRFTNRAPALGPVAQSGRVRRHAIVGIFAGLVFGLHVDFSWPETAFELTLFVLFVTTFASGLIGIYLTTVLPMRMARIDHSEAGEDIAEIRARLAISARNLATANFERTGSRALIELYASGLHTFFQQPRHALAHLNGSRQPLARMVFEIDQIDDGIADGGSGAMDEFKDLVRTKFELDRRHAHELAMQSWLLVHLPATYALVVATVVHVCIAYAFTTGGPMLLAPHTQ